MSDDINQLKAELEELRNFRKVVEPKIREMYDVLYWREEMGAYDPNKDWDVDYLEMLADILCDVYGRPDAGDTLSPKVIIP